MDYELDLRIQGIVRLEWWFFDRLSCAKVSIICTVCCRISPKDRNLGVLELQPITTDNAIQMHAAGRWPPESPIAACRIRYGRF